MIGDYSGAIVRCECCGLNMYVWDEPGAPQPELCDYCATADEDWRDTISAAAALPDSELGAHADVSTRNAHACESCFTCACALVRDVRRGVSPLISVKRRAEMAR